VIADTDTDGRDFAETFEPSFEAGAVGRSVDGFEVVDEIAGDSNDLRLLLFGEFGGLLEVISSAFAKMNVTDGKNLVLLLSRLVETVTIMVERFHLVLLWALEWGLSTTAL
jgi:hypothetical protein